MVRLDHIKGNDILKFDKFIEIIEKPQKGRIEDEKIFRTKTEAS